MKYQVHVYFSGFVGVEVEGDNEECALAAGRDRVYGMSEEQLKNEVAHTLEPWGSCDAVKAV